MMSLLLAIVHDQPWKVNRVTSKERNFVMTSALRVYALQEIHDRTRKRTLFLVLSVNATMDEGYI
jgi:hypothetical protein